MQQLLHVLCIALVLIVQINAKDASNDTRGYNDVPCQGDRRVIVHLFEWPWNDVAEECETYLGPKGYCGVQVSPPMEHIVTSQWWARYQPVSYKLESRGGNRQQFIDMVDRCKAVGVNIFVDAVINHMSGLDSEGTGTGGSSFSGGGQSYSGVPYSSLDFNQPICDIQDYGNPTEVRNCYLVGLNDLAGAKSYVQEKIAGYLQDCIDIGVVGFRVDAAKHMWPDDIKNTINKADMAFYVHEVIDQGGEPIRVQEYFGVGRTTEFRYGLKVGDLVRNKNYAGLGGVYDQGWGMADPDHAMVFIDNHDNQRGHGGGGSLLTHEDPWNYKIGSSFMLAHDYGFKRVMSSYYYNGDTDAGAPNDHPHTDCGGGFACEHRWASIGNMIQFTNAVYGTDVGNWVGGSDMLAFSRGNKGFFAMGNVNGDFDTGLPDGEYCDIISECEQMITISGGRGHFKPHNGDEPVVAICVGCGKSAPPTTSKPTTTTTTKTTTKGETTTKTTTTKTTTTSTPGTTEAGFCCDKISISSSGGIAEHYPELLGEYVMINDEENGRPIFKKQTILTTMHLHYTEDSYYKWEGWMVTRNDNETFGYIANQGDNYCPLGLNSGWEYQLASGWMSDSTAQVTCGDDGPNPTDGPGPTNGGETTTTPKPTNPGPGGMQPTIVAIKRQTVPGSDVFIIGGVAPDQQIDISLYPFPANWESYNDWMVGDDHLDWDGPEEGQGEHAPDENDPTEYPAMGTPGAWTTNDPTDDFYYSLNSFGPHYWFIVMDMDCDQTQGGWFEFSTIYSIGGEDGESAIAQEECTGEVGGAAPFTSSNHIARCGFFNVFSYGSGECQIDNMPDIPN